MSRFDPHSKVLKVVVAVDGKHVEEIHQHRPGSLSVAAPMGRGGDLALHDGTPRATTWRPLAHLWLATGVLGFVTGAGLFAWEVYQHALVAAAVEAKALEDVWGQAGHEGTGGLGLAVALIALVPLMMGVVGFREGPASTAEDCEDQPDSALPSTRHRLFEYKAGAYYVNLTPWMEGRILIAKGHASSVTRLREVHGRGGGIKLRLPPEGRGKLELGDTQIFFQLVDPAPAPERLSLPRGLFDPLRHFRLFPIERLVFGVSAAGLGFLFFALAFLVDPTEPEPEERFADVMDIPVSKFEAKQDEEDKDPEPEQEHPPEEGDPDAHRTPNKPAPQQSTRVDRVVHQRPTSYSKQAVDKARAVGVAKVMGEMGGPTGSLLATMTQGESNLDDLFAQGMTSTVAAQGPGEESRFVGGEGIAESGRLKQAKGLATGGGPVKIAKAAKREKAIKGHVKSNTTDIYGDVDHGRVKATIRRRMGALQACYEKSLRGRPDLKGKMSYTISINPMGRVTTVSIEEDTLRDGPATTCIKAKIKGWRFPTEGAEDSSEVTFSVLFSGD